MSLVKAKPHKDFVHRLQRGDDRAWEQFVSEWSPRLYNYMRYNLPSMKDVDAVLGRTMKAIVESIYRFDESMTFEAFVYSIAVREVGYFYHQRRHVGQLAIIETMQAMSSTGASNPDASTGGEPLEFYQTLAQLPDPSRQAMLLRYRIGFSVDEVARIVGQSYNATCSLLRQGQRQFGADTAM